MCVCVRCVVCYDLGFSYLLLLCVFLLFFSFAGFTGLLTCYFFSRFFGLFFSFLRCVFFSMSTVLLFGNADWNFLLFSFDFFCLSLSLSLLLSVPFSCSLFKVFCRCCRRFSHYSLALFHFICNKSINRRYRFVGI